jgi:hypothetical protein
MVTSWPPRRTNHQAAVHAQSVRPDPTADGAGICLIGCSLMAARSAAAIVPATCSLTPPVGHAASVAPCVSHDLVLHPEFGDEVLKPPKLPRRLVVPVRLPQCRHQFPQCEYETPPIIDRGSDLQRHVEVPDRVGPVTEAELGRGERGQCIALAIPVACDAVDLERPLRGVAGLGVVSLLDWMSLRFPSAWPCPARRRHTRYAT